VDTSLDTDSSLAAMPSLSLHVMRILTDATSSTYNGDETPFEYRSDLVIGFLFLVISYMSMNRMTWSFRQGGADTTVVTAFYTLIYITSTLRSLWFLIPNHWLKKSYTPSAVFAFGDQPWIGTLFNSLLLTMGSLSLFFIFILILVYWADILKKYFHPGERRSKPMDTFLQVAFSLLFLEACNYICFLTRMYSSEGMILFNSLLLATVSSVCVFKITMFSKKFSTVLKTLGDINQVSTESQVKRIRWITVTGNLFFFLRALVESIFGLTILFYWAKTGNVQDALSHKYWDSYILLRHVSELMILFLVLYILQNKFDTRQKQADYERIPNSDDLDTGTLV